jgi:HEAT repeat protein
MQEPSPIQVTTQVGLNGDSANFVFPHDVTFSELTKELEELFQIPKEYQKLIVGEALPANHELIKDYCEVENKLSVTLLIAASDIMQDLQAGDSKWLLVKRGLAALVGHFKTTGIPLIEGVLNDTKFWYVKTSALEALSSVADKDDLDVINLITNYLTDNEYMVRLTAIKALATFMERGQRHLFENLRGCLQDSRLEVKCNAMQALVNAAKNDDVYASALLPELRLLLQSDDSVVRIKAIDCLGQVAKRGDKDALAAVQVHVEAPHWSIRKAAVVSTGELATKHDDDAKKLLLLRIAEDADQSVKEAAQSALQQIESG